MLYLLASPPKCVFGWLLTLVSFLVYSLTVDFLNTKWSLHKEQEQYRVDISAKVSPERFTEGMIIKEFVRSMSKNREIFEENYQNVTLREHDTDLLRRLDRKLNVIVLAEDWCGDVLRYVPVFARMAEVAGTWDVRVFCRDENLDMADLWLKEGKFRAIPVIAFLDEGLDEIACYVEKPRVVYAEDK